MLHKQKWLLVLLIAVLLIPQTATAAKSEGASKNKSHSSKVIYLTFDDGPTAHTMQLLDILDQYNAKATFFMLGPHMEHFPAATKRIVKEGNGLGLHGVTHVVSKFYSSPYSAYKEMKGANESLHKVTGKYTSLVRTPYGSKPYLKKSYRDIMLSTGGFHLWDWNVDSLDWKYKKDHQKVCNNVMSEVKSAERRGMDPVILMHDQPATLKVLPSVLKELKAQGYQFKILDKQVSPLNFWNDRR
ncbi:polysaccharide deacetylase family protein [Paenibacillus sp. Z6-24]